MFRLLRPILAIFGLGVARAPTSHGATKERFYDAVQIGDLNTVKRMLASEPTLARSTDKFLFQPIHLMDLHFEPGILDVLLKNGAEINARNEDGITIAHIVNDPDAIALLAARGADIEARDLQGNTPLLLQTASQQNGPDVVEALLAAGADPDARNNKGESALDIARQIHDEALVAMLMRASATRQES